MNNLTLYSDPLVTNLGSRELTDKLNRTMGCNVHSLRSAILVLLSYSIYMSYEEIYSLHPVMSHVRTELETLISKGYVVKKEFGQAVGTCSIFFAITMSGFDEARKRCVGYLPVRYKYARKSAAYIHTYYSGYNLFQILKLPFRFSWEREYLGDNYGYKKDFKKRILQVDALCTLNPNTDEARKLYIEEDTGSENFSILLGKMENYINLSYINPHRINDMVIFSCVDDSVGSHHSRSDGPNPFNERKVRGLLKDMEQNECDDAFSLFVKNGFRDDFTGVLLKTVGALSIDEYGQFYKTNIICDREFLTTYRQGLMHMRNPYLASRINGMHVLVSKRRLHSLSVEAVKGFMKHRWVYPMSLGYQVLCVPTPLLADRLRYTMLSTFDSVRTRLEDFLSGYFKDAKFDADISGDIPLATGEGVRYKKLRLRNKFKYLRGDGVGHVFVEMPFLDAGSWLRCFLFYRYYKGSEPVNIVCLFEDSSQAEMFYKMLGYSYKSMDIDHSMCGIFGADLNTIKDASASELYIMDEFIDYKEKSTFLSFFY